MINRFDASFECLYHAECPEWFRDAKFGIWSHWGPQSVPMYGDWYARNMYVEGTPQYLYHLRRFGHPSKFGYKDICAMWKAENFDPNGLMELYYKAGARYFVALAMHHDHFFNYPSKLNRMNSVAVGPKKDICGLWKQAAKRYDMPFGLTEHLGASFSWWRHNKGHDKHGLYKGIPYDGNDPAWADFYHDNSCHGSDEKDSYLPWYTDNADFRRYWLKAMKELIDMFKPDLLYSDGTLPFGEHWMSDCNENAVNPDFSLGLEAVAYLYNSSIEKHGKNRAVYLQKSKRPEVYRVGLLDVERSQLPGINPEPWQTDTCIGGWFYDVRNEYKSPSQIIEMLVDIISKNGTMLLNIPQRPDGTIDDETKSILSELASWFAICSEGVYNTRPWKTAGEGVTNVVIDGFCEDKTRWNHTDFRFTQKGNTVYAFMMSNDSTAVLRSFNDGESIKSVRLLGVGEVEYEHSLGILTVKLPDSLPTDYVNCIAVERG